jgi:hypothetical protein
MRSENSFQLPASSWNLLDAAVMEAGSRDLRDQKLKSRKLGPRSWKPEAGSWKLF